MYPTAEKANKGAMIMAIRFTDDYTKMPNCPNKDMKTRLWERTRLAC